MLRRSQKWVFDCLRIALQRYPELRIGQVIDNALQGRTGNLCTISDDQLGLLLLVHHPERIPR